MRIKFVYKALYGFRESPLAWYKTLSDYTEKLGFKRSKYDSCLFVNNESKDPICLLIFVEEILISSRDKRAMDKLKLKSMERFAMKDLGYIRNYIGIDVIYEKGENKMLLNRKKYIESLVKKYRS